MCFMSIFRCCFTCCEGDSSSRRVCTDPSESERANWYGSRAGEGEPAPGNSRQMEIQPLDLDRNALRKCQAAIETGSRSPREGEGGRKDENTQAPTPSLQLQPSIQLSPQTMRAIFIDLPLLTEEREDSEMAERERRRRKIEYIANDLRSSTPPHLAPLRINPNARHEDSRRPEHDLESSPDSTETDM